MKKIYSFILLITFSSLAVNAQHYGFSMRNEAYVELTGDIITLTNGDWDQEGFLTEIPIEFDVFGIPADTMVIADQTLQFRSLANTVLGDFLAIGTDMIARGSVSSPINVLIDGEEPNRIVKIQYENAGFANDFSFKDFCNYQIWMYEGTNVLEVHYGKSDVKNANSWGGETGPRVEIVTEDFSAGISLKGDPNNPTVVPDKDLLNEFEVLNGLPDSGTVYVFTPRKFPVGITNAVAKGIDALMYPNPFNNVINIDLNDAVEGDVVITNALGMVVYNQHINSQYTIVDATEFDRGIYFITVTTSEGILTKKLIKD